MLIRVAATAAPGEFTVNYDGWHASDAVMLRFGSHFGLVHVVDDYLMRRTQLSARLGRLFPYTPNNRR